MYVIFILLTIMISCVAEFYLGSWRVMLPFVGNAVFYFTVAGSWKSGLFAAVAGGVLLDLAWGRTGFYTAAALVLWTFAARGWARRHLETPVVANLIPGAALPAFLALAAWGLQIISGFDRPIELDWMRCSELLLAGIFNAPALVITIILLDSVAGACGLDRFAQSFERHKREAEDV
ncbi:MAG: hypothetical protein AB7F40_01365 [Victivallaceae bacterium]|nr:hypothetical protein [Victivallaceae bacterium]